MKRVVIVFLMLMMAAALLGLVGCGEKKVTVKTEEGESTITTKEVTEKDIGIPIYPGAKSEEGAFEAEGKEGTWGIATLVTDDDVDKVIAWYKQKLSGEKDFQDTSVDFEGAKMGSFSFTSEGKQKSVLISQDEDSGKTVIAVSTASGTDLTPDETVPEESE